MGNKVFIADRRLALQNRSATSPQGVRVEEPCTHPLHLRVMYPLLFTYYGLMARIPALGRWLLWQNPRERDVLRFPATSTALHAIYTYPGFLGTLRETGGNPWAAFWGAVHENCLNAWAVRYRTAIAADLLVEAIERGAREIVDLAAGSALAPWLAIKEVGFGGQVYLVDTDPFSLLNTYRAAAEMGLLGEVPIEPALVLDQSKVGSMAFGKAETVLRRVNQALGLDLTLEQLLDLELVAPGGLTSRVRKDARVIPILGDAQDLNRFLGEGQSFDVALVLGFLDYLPPQEIVDDLSRVALILGPGGRLIASHMQPNPEQSWVLKVPWWGATSNGWPLKPKTLPDFVELVERAGFEASRVLTTPGNIYTIVVGRRRE